jgi:hypothetical protein
MKLGSIVRGPRVTGEGHKIGEGDGMLGGIEPECLDRARAVDVLLDIKWSLEGIAPD